jgi:hypothetical protein
MAKKKMSKAAAPVAPAVRKITECKIGPMPKGLFDPMPNVNVTYNDGTTERLFSYYPDELSFSESEFIGLTRDEAFALHRKKDVSFLQS